MRMTTPAEFIKGFPIPLHYRPPESPGKSWVFWSQSEESQETSTSASVGTEMIHEKVKLAFSDLIGKLGLICQFWAPVTIGGIQLLSTSGQPFAVRDLFEEFAEYRLASAEYRYFIDVNRLDIEQDALIRCGGPATAFLNRLPYMEDLVGSPFESNPSCNSWAFSIMLPICFPPQSSCIGVVECSGGCRCHDLGPFVFDMKMALQKAGLDVCNVQDLIPYKAINGLKHAQGQIAIALRNVCVSHDLILAQVWIRYQSFSVKDMEQMSVLKLTGYLEDERPKGDGELNVYRHSSSYPSEEHLERKLHYFWLYYSLCDVIPQRTVKELALKTLQDFKPRYTSKLPADMLIEWGQDCCAFAISLRCADTGDFDYAFEFIWLHHSDTVILLGALILTLKRCLPSFKFSSGAELGDELDVIDVGGSKDGETSNFKILQGKRYSPIPRVLGEGMRPMVGDYMAPSKGTYKTTPIRLPREVIQRQFGKTMRDAANDLGVSVSTLKNKSRALGILEWPGPLFYKRAIQEPSTENITKDTRGIEYHLDDIFNLPKSQETFVSGNGKLFHGKQLSLTPRALEEGNKPILVDSVAPMKGTYKTALKLLSREDIEKQFGKTMKEAAKSLGVSLTTLKRKLKDHDIQEWRGPKFRKKKAKDPSIIQDNASEEDDVAFQEPSAVGINKDTQPIILGREDVEKQSGRTMKDVAQNLMMI